MSHNAWIQRSFSGADDKSLIDFSNLLFQSGGKKYPLLIMGPGAVQYLQLRQAELPPLHWHIIFKAIFSWCVGQHLFEGQQTENEFRTILDTGAWFSIGFQLEKYLSDKAEMQRCLKDVLPTIARPSKLQSHLVRFPFRGFISTTYDLDIETTYEQRYQQKLSKLYGSSIQDTLHLSRREQPFLLKLYGDIEHADSLIFGRRWTQGITCLSGLQLLHSLLLSSPIVFYGFNEDDADYRYFKSIIDEHSQFKDSSIMISEVMEEQPQALKPDQVNHVDLYDKFSSYLPSRTFFNAIDVAEIDKYQPLYNHISNSLESAQKRYTDAPSILEKQQQSGSADRIPIEVYSIYSEEDSNYYKNIQKYVLKVLESLDLGCDITCFEHEVTRSNQWLDEDHLLTASLILPLISLSFITSKILKGEHMKKAVFRHKRREIYIVPILVQPADVWTETILGNLAAMPTSGKAISQWKHPQAAYNDIVNHLKLILKKLSYE